MASDKQIALKALEARKAAITKYQRYYDGDHDLQFASEKFDSIFGALFEEFSYNLCAAVIDAVSDRLRLLSFGTTPAAIKAWDIWIANQMNEQAGQLYQSALTNGAAYVIVWPGSTGEPRLMINSADLVVTFHDPEDPKRVAWAAKCWRTADRTIRLTLYYPDRIEKWVTAPRDGGAIPADTSFLPYRIEGEKWPLDNPLGRVPVVPFINNAKLGGTGQSDIKAVIPLQDALNKAVADMMVNMEFAAFQQRWVTGLEIRYDKDNKPIKPFEPGAERLWYGPEGAQFGAFPASDLTQFLAVIESFEVKIARVSRTSQIFLQLFTGQPPSGESLKTSETPFLNKVGDRMEAWGNAWVEVMQLALTIAKQAYAPGDLAPDWRDPAPKSRKESAETGKVKIDIGVPFPWVAREDLDYTEAEVKDMIAYQETQTAAEDAAAVNRLKQAQEAVNNGVGAAVVLAAEDTSSTGIQQ